MADYETHEHDVLVIGAGGAGLRAAIEASAAGVRVGLVCKSLLGKAHTVMAEGGIAAALANVDERDNWKVHFADTMRGGQYVNQWRMVELHAKEVPDRVRELEAWGAVFDRTKDGRILQRHFGGHKYPRLAHVGDRTGLEMIRTLQDHGVHQGIDVYMEHTVLSLLKDGDRVVGAFGYERERGRFKILRAKAIVLATGGIGRAYQITSNSWEGTGDGHSLAYHAGAELIDMEFVQFHPTGMVWPPSVKGILVTEGVRGEGGVLRNNKGERFMFNDITKEPMEVRPTTHYIMGGVRVNADSQMSSLPGLFAAGECAAGINGANRLGGNSLSDLLVFGKRAGEYAARFSKENDFGKINNDKIDLVVRKAVAPFERNNGENPYQVQKDLQELMQDNVGIVRNESEMRSALERLKEFWQRANRAGVTGNREFNPGWHTVLDLKNLLTVSEGITRAALERKESRGAQFREDYPNKDEKFSKVNTMISKADDGSMRIRLEPLPEMPDYLKRVVEENG